MVGSLYHKLIYPWILNKDGEIHGTMWFPVAESPSKNTNLRGLNIPKRVFFDRCPLFRSNLSLQYFTVHALLLSENKEKNVLHGFENSTSSFLLF